MTIPRDPWPSEDSSPFAPPQVEDADADELRDEAENQTFDRLSSDALTVPINTQGMTRPLSWSRVAPRPPHITEQWRPDRSPLAALILGIVIGVILSSIVAALISASMAGSARSRAGASIPKVTRTLPTVTATRIPTATPVPAVAATFNTTDTTTQGTWQGDYGNQGAVVIGDTQQLPAGIQVTPNGVAGALWAATTPDPRAPQKLSNPADRIAACWYAPTSFTIDVNITDGQAHRVALYLLDWDSENRSEVVTVTDAATGAALDTRIVSGFIGGQYLVWTVRGHVVLQVTNNAGSVNAVVSALFFSKA